jgi:hypothetical protein
MASHYKGSRKIKPRKLAHLSPACKGDQARTARSKGKSSSEDQTAKQLLGVCVAALPLLSDETRTKISGFVSLKQFATVAVSAVPNRALARERAFVGARWRTYRPE